MSLEEYGLTSAEMARRWSQRWVFPPIWQGIAWRAEDRQHFADGHRFPDGPAELAEATAASRDVWTELVGAPRSKPRLQIVVTYKLVFEAVPGRDDAPVRPDLEECEEAFGGEHCHTEPFGHRFADEPLGMAHWYITAGRYGWSRLAPLIAKALPRYPLNATGGLIVAAPDFSWVWHPYDGGSLVLKG